MLHINLKKLLLISLTPLFILSFSANACFSLPISNIQKLDLFHTFTGSLSAKLALAKTHQVRLTPTTTFFNQQGKPAYKPTKLIAGPQGFFWLGKKHVIDGYTNQQIFATLKANKRRNTQP